MLVRHAGLALHLDVCHPGAALLDEALAWRQLAALLQRCVPPAVAALRTYRRPPSARRRATMEPGTSNVRNKTLKTRLDGTRLDST